MKAIVLLFLFPLFMVGDMKTGERIIPVRIIHQKESIDFKTQILPVLQKRCSPCHFPGGKMYVRLPFDTASSLLLKKEIILKRIKDDSENKLIQQFIAENQK
jgi:hypothetical protein